MKKIGRICIALILAFYSSINYAIDYSASTEKIIAEMLQGLITSVPQEKEATKEIYRLSAHRLIWLNSKQTEVALILLATADTKGLNNEDYQSQWLNLQWQQLKKNSRPSFYQLALFDSTLTNSILHYYSDLRYGRINPERVRFLFEPNKDPINLAQQILNAIQKSTMLQLSDAFEPKLHFYHNLKRALHNYQKASKEHPLLAFKFPPSLKTGDSDPQVIELRRLLITLGDFIFIKGINSTVLNSPLYDKAMTEAIRHFQQRHGLKATGHVDRKTVKKLNIPLSKRIQQIKLGLERFRWIPRYKEDKLIFVNVPSFRLWAFNSLKDKKIEPLSIRVVVGKASRTRTPIFSSKMKYLVFRPYWGIPYSILKNEVFPGMKRDANYLANRNMELVGNRVRQRPGGRNALGLVKFIFPNKYSIYLHDTPSKSLFKRTRRDFSHGCVRVSQPADLASYLLNWKPKKVKRAMYKGRGSQRAKLEKEIPVIIFYSTVMAADDATVTFLNDVYGYDARLKRELNKKHNAI
jgi:murein L,D-transpeptidase YcbB/YkuD